MKRALIILAVILAIFLPGKMADAASLTIEPSTGSFTVGSTFDVSIYLNTEGKSVNALDVSIQFPAGKLQVVSPSTGNSVIGVWTSQPKFDNQNGTVRLQGGMPGGINVSKGLVGTLTFRVRGVGSSIVKFGSESKVLANDGKATDLLDEAQSAVFNLTLPPPEGPVVVSHTHPDQTRWYPNGTAALEWTTDAETESYSYMLNDLPVDTPDNISEGSNTSVSYKNLRDGRYYFHIRAFRNGVWGGVTHFAFKTDTTPPADFPIEIIPSARTTRLQPVIQFVTSDSLSGIEKYELKLISLQATNEVDAESGGGQLLFFEATSPYVTPELEQGAYDVIIRAYDAAGNIKEETKRIKIVPAVFRFASDRGLELRSTITIPWIIIWLLLAVLISLLIHFAKHTKLWHETMDSALVKKIWPTHIQEQLKHLREYKSKYARLIPLFLLVAASLVFTTPVSAQFSDVEIGPAVVTSVSKDISSEEIFYIGGRAGAANMQVIIYVQNTQTLETFNTSTQTDKMGNWFYRHSTFLTPGSYVLWVQTKSGDTLSPPSPQIEITVRQTALKFGGSRITYEIFYLGLTIIFFITILILGSYIALHGTQARRKQKLFDREVREAEEAIRKGFAVLRRDIEAELSIIKRAKLSQSLSEEERIKEEQLLKDLDFAEKYAGKEIWDLEKLGAL